MTKRKKFERIEIPLEALNVVREAKTKVQVEALSVVKEGKVKIDFKRIGVAFEPYGYLPQIKNNRRRFKLWFYYRGVPYPFGYIGSLSQLIKKLGISQDEAKTFVLKKLREEMSIATEKEDKPLIEFLERKIKELKPKTPKFEKRICRTCGLEFQPRFYTQKNCGKCIDLWKSKRLKDMGLKHHE